MWDVWPNGKALDVRLPMPSFLLVTNLCHSTNQEIHGSIPCTFIFISLNFYILYLFLWDKRRKRHYATLLLCSQRLPTTADKHLAVPAIKQSW